MYTCAGAVCVSRPQSAEEGSGSKANIAEAGIVLRHVLALLTAGVRPSEVAVVTPYNAQVAVLRAFLGAYTAASGVEVRSVDGFQGQEKEAIVLSLVRSNVSREVGFLRDYRRMNVAVTRARRHVAIVSVARGRALLRQLCLAPYPHPVAAVACADWRQRDGGGRPAHGAAGAGVQ